MNNAIGMVAPTVDTPQGLSASAFTTTKARTANKMIIMAKMAAAPMYPAVEFSSSRTIWLKDLPSRRMEAKRITKSCTAPPNTTPIRIQSVPGRYPNCAARTGPTSGPGPEIAAKWWPKTIHLFVRTKSLPSSCTSQGVARRSLSIRMRVAIHRE